jgi:hypothetical protein
LSSHFDDDSHQSAINLLHAISTRKTSMPIAFNADSLGGLHRPCLDAANISLCTQRILTRSLAPSSRPIELPAR